jgi:hypothetical protein
LRTVVMLAGVASTEDKVQTSISEQMDGLLGM